MPRPCATSRSVTAAPDPRRGVVTLTTLATLATPLLLALCGGATLAAQASPSGGSPPAILLRHATLLDGVAPRPRRDVAIVLRGGRIESVRPDREGTPPGGDVPDSVIDLHGAWVVPGLIDAHAHMGVATQWMEDDSVAAQRALDGGVTTIRSMGSIPGFGDVKLKELSVAGGARVPRLVVAGEWLLPIVGEEWLRDFPTVRPLLAPASPADSARRLSPGPGWRLTGNVAAIDSVVGILRARGVDWVKAFATGRAGVASSDPRTTFLTEGDLRAVVRAAHRRGLEVAAHAHGDEGIRAAVLAGARTIEHGTYASEATLHLMMERRACLVPTLHAWDEPSADPVVQARAVVMREAAKRAVRRARDLGVAVIAGTDGAYAPWQEGLVSELLALAEAGLSPAEVLRAATSRSASCLGLADRVGTVAPGLEADLLVTDEDPRADLARLGAPRMVFLAGRIVGRVPLGAVIRTVLAREGIEAARARFLGLNESRVDSVRYGEYELTMLGYERLQAGQVEEAIAVFEMNVAAYPDAPNPWDSLGDALLAAGRRQEALEAFGRAVDLATEQNDPRLPMFRAKLDGGTR